MQNLIDLTKAIISYSVQHDQVAIQRINSISENASVVKEFIDQLSSSASEAIDETTKSAIIAIKKSINPDFFEPGSTDYLRFKGLENLVFPGQVNLFQKNFSARLGVKQLSGPSIKLIGLQIDFPSISFEGQVSKVEIDFLRLLPSYFELNTSSTEKSFVHFDSRWEMKVFSGWSGKLSGDFNAAINFGIEDSRNAAIAIEESLIGNNFYMDQIMSSVNIDIGLNLSFSLLNLSLSNEKTFDNRLDLSDMAFSSVSITALCQVTKSISDQFSGIINQSSKLSFYNDFYLNQKLSLLDKVYYLPYLDAVSTRDILVRNNKPDQVRVIDSNLNFTIKSEVSYSWNFLDYLMKSFGYEISINKDSIILKSMEFSDEISLIYSSYNSTNDLIIFKEFSFGGKRGSQLILKGSTLGCEFIEDFSSSKIGQYFNIYRSNNSGSLKIDSKLVKGEYGIVFSEYQTKLSDSNIFNNQFLWLKKKCISYNLISSESTNFSSIDYIGINLVWRNENLKALVYIGKTSISVGFSILGETIINWNNATEKLKSVFSLNTGIRSDWLDYFFSKLNESFNQIDPSEKFIIETTYTLWPKDKSGNFTTTSMELEQVDSFYKLPKIKVEALKSDFELFLQNNPANPPKVYMKDWFYLEEISLRIPFEIVSNGDGVENSKSFLKDNLPITTGFDQSISSVKTYELFKMYVTDGSYTKDLIVSDESDESKSIEQYSSTFPLTIFF